MVKSRSRCDSQACECVVLDEVGDDGQRADGVAVTK